jgi:outer membrane protein assembly factor BamD (BamD/ComL family)
MTPNRIRDTRNRPRVRRTRTAAFLLLSLLLGAPAQVHSQEAQSLDVTAFQAALERSDEVGALATGESVLAAVQQKYVADAGFQAYESRLRAAQFLAAQMQQQLGKAAGTRLSAVAADVPGQGSKSAASLTILAPAQRFYETSTRVFANPVHIDAVSIADKTFLTEYYDLKLRSLIAAVARAGQALAIAEPGFTGTYDYVLVLPLLHASEQQPLDIKVLPRWMQVPDQLRILSDSCLFHFELPFQAMAIARQSAARQAEAFSELDFYRAAARRCNHAQARIAVQCLERAMSHVPAEAGDLAIGLRFEIIQVWLESGNFPLAASQARTIFEKHPGHADAGRAIWLYYYALSRSNNPEEILASIDQALADVRCKPYEPKLTYIKWWALRRQRNQSARVAALEYDLLKRFGDDPMVAPILLSRATDLLASQSYTEACHILQQLTQKFPSTQAAVQAQRMLDRLKTMNDRE